MVLVHWPFFFFLGGGGQKEKHVVSGCVDNFAWKNIYKSFSEEGTRLN